MFGWEAEINQLFATLHANLFGQLNSVCFIAFLIDDVVESFANSIDEFAPSHLIRFDSDILGEVKFLEVVVERRLFDARIDDAKLADN